MSDSTGAGADVTSDEARCRIVEVAHLASARGIMNAFEGNISHRVGDRVYETPTSTAKELLTPDQVIAIDLAGNQLEGTLAPTSETGLHLACYEARPDVAAVVHAHAPYCTAWAQAEMDFTDDASAEMQVLFGGRIPCAAYGRQGTPAISADVPRCLALSDVVLLAHHGVVAVGATPFDAYAKIQSAEGLMHAFLIRHLAFGDKAADLPTAELEALR